MNDITHTQYWNEVKETAEFSLDACLTNGNDIRDFTHEVIDGHQWIIYTFYHDQILRFTDNDEAYQDCYSNKDLGRVVAENGLDHVKMIQAFFAFEQDVNGALSDLIQEKREDLEAKLEKAESLKDKLESRIEEIESQLEVLA